LDSSLPFEDIPIVLEVDDTPSGWCQPCGDAFDAEDEVLPPCCNMACMCDEECNCDEDCKCPCDFPDQAPDGLEWHSIFIHMPTSGENTLILQCNATTDEGRRCEAKCAAWDFANDPLIVEIHAESKSADRPFSDMDFWLCKEHLPECPHCDFIAGGKLAELRENTNMWLLDHWNLWDDEGNQVGRGLHCIHCFCKFDANLDLVEPGKECAIWGRGPRPGTIEEALYENPALLVEAFNYYIDTHYKRNRLKEWREQLQREQDEGDLE
jgi:hypothetical protein